MTGKGEKEPFENKKKKRYSSGRNIQVRFWTTEEVAGRLGEQAAERRSSISEVVHRHVTWGLHENPLTELDKKIADEEMKIVNAEAQQKEAKITFDISMIPGRVKEFCEVSDGKGLPHEDIIKGIIDPNIRALKEYGEHEGSAWAVSELEKLKEKYKEKV